MTDTSLSRSKKDEKDEASNSRRDFIKKTLLSGVALSSTALLAQKVSKMIVVNDVVNDADYYYARDMRIGDSIMAKKELVLMSKKEKEDVLKVCIDGYNKKENHPYDTIKEV